jgi:dTDP-4-amino-4,6-dideoxygalactose transaminase
MSRVLRFHGSEDKRTFTHVGYNSRLDELQAAILLELRPHVDAWNDGRIAVATRYEELGLGEHVVLPAVAAGARHVYHLYIVRTQERERLVGGLTEAGIGNMVYYSTPLHRQPVFEHLGYPEGALPVTERCARECVALPMSPTLGEAAQREVVDAVTALSPART